MKTSILKNNAGVSLIELMVVVGLMATILVLIFIPQMEIQNRLNQVDKKIGRISRINEMKLEIVNRESSLTYSAGVNSDNSSLCPCVRGGAFASGGSLVCSNSVCQANQDIDFSFYAPQAPNPKLTGTASSPVYYREDGGNCEGVDNPEAICAYKVTTQFKAHCAGDLVTCDHADYISLTLSLKHLNTYTHIMDETANFLYFVNLNYPPIIETTVANQLVNLGTPKTIAINANAGFPTESQNLIFEKCTSSHPAVLEVKCYKFVSGKGMMTLVPKTTGSATVTFQLNDGAVENNLSAQQIFSVVVAP
ncbi:MAG: hypothetical protein AAGB31_12485 [Bdellovibrio sp.]